MKTTKIYTLSFFVVTVETDDSTLNVKIIAKSSKDQPSVALMLRSVQMALFSAMDSGCSVQFTDEQITISECDRRTVLQMAAFFGDYISTFLVTEAG